MELWQVLHCRWTVGRVLLVVGLGVCVYQAYRQWRVRRSLARLRGRVVLITGASSGLGEALAHVFHMLGSKVILASRDLQQLQRVKFELDNNHIQKPSSPLRHSPKLLQLDLADGAALPSRAQVALELFGRVDVLVNNAGISSRGAVLDTHPATDRKLMEVNFFGTIAFTKAILPSMLERGGGNVVVISSLQGKIGLPFRSSYSASKHALQGYFDSLRAELSLRGVRVTLVSPGYINTKLSVNALEGDGRKHGKLDGSTARGMSPQSAAQRVVQAVSLGERELILASPSHHAAVYLHLLLPFLLDRILQLRTPVT